MDTEKKEEKKEEVKINEDDGIETLIMSETDELSEIDENPKPSKKKEEDNELTRVELKEELEKLKAERVSREKEDEEATIKSLDAYVKMTTTYRKQRKQDNQSLI